MRLIDATALIAYLNNLEKQPLVGYGEYELLEMIVSAVQEFADKAGTTTLETVQWHDGLPPEHDSIFAQYKGTNKWMPSMFEKASQKVLVTIEHKSGARMTVVAKTIDGEWKDIPLANEVKVVAWAEFPTPKEKNQT